MALLNNILPELLTVGIVLAFYFTLKADAKRAESEDSESDNQ